MEKNKLNLGDWGWSPIVFFCFVATEVFSTVQSGFSGMCIFRFDQILDQKSMRVMTLNLVEPFWIARAKLCACIGLSELTDRLQRSINLRVILKQYIVHGCLQSFIFTTWFIFFAPTFSCLCRFFFQLPESGRCNRLTSFKAYDVTFRCDQIVFCELDRN